MDEVDGVRGDDVGAGRDSPAQQLLEGGEGSGEKQKAEMALQDHGITDDGTGRGEIIVRAGGLRIVQATEEEQAAITQLLKEREAEAPGAAPTLGTSALVSAGLKLAGILFVVAGMDGGLGDLIHPHDSGGGPTHHAAVRREEESKKPTLRSRAAAEDGQKTEDTNGEHGTEPVGTECEVRAASRETFPINLLKQVLDSTLEQQAAIERILDRQGLLEHQRRPPLANEPSQAAMPVPSQPNEPNLSLAAKLFQLLTALDPDNRLRKAPPIKVFLLRFRQNRSRSEIARICHCGKSLVALRLSTIQQRLPWKPQQLQELSAHVEAMQDAVSDSRARKIYRSGAIYGDESGGEESG